MPGTATNSSKKIYSFGMVMFGRSYAATSSYRFGFNNKENDNEVEGNGNSIDFGARIYDSRLGQMLNIDPAFNKFPSSSPYSFAGRNPIFCIDKNGNWPWPGVTFFFLEGHIGGGFAYGLNVLQQTGIVEDHIGKTHLSVSSKLYIVNQDLQEGSSHPKFLFGAGGGLGVGIKQDWKHSSFYEIAEESENEMNSQTKASGKVEFGVGIGLDKSSITITLGLEVGFKVSVLSTHVDDAISLTDDEAGKVDDAATGIWTPVWLVTDKRAIISKDGVVTGYEGTVATKNKDGAIVKTGVKVYSEATKDSKGQSVSNEVWMSKDYKNKAKTETDKKKAEEEKNHDASNDDTYKDTN